MNSIEDPSIRLMLGYLCISGEKDSSLPKKVEVLDRFKLSTEDISTICACSPQSVKNARQELKKANQKRQTKK